MKYVITLILTLSSGVAFAETASQAERALLCASINAALEEAAADMGLDTKACLRNTGIRSRLLAEGIREVKGTVTFNAPNRPGFKLECTLSYAWTPKRENVVSAVACK